MKCPICDTDLRSPPVTTSTSTSTEFSTVWECPSYCFFSMWKNNQINFYTIHQRTDNYYHILCSDGEPDERYRPYTELRSGPPIVNAADEIYLQHFKSMLRLDHFLPIIVQGEKLITPLPRLLQLKAFL
jgi:hypothetical protein